MFAVVDVPLEAKSIQQVFKLDVIGLVEVGQEAVKQFAAAHTRSRLHGAGEIDVHNLRHNLLIINRRAQFSSPSFLSVWGTGEKFPVPAGKFARYIRVCQSYGSNTVLFCPKIFHNSSEHPNIRLLFVLLHF